MTINHDDFCNEDLHLRCLSVYKVGGSTQPLEGEHFKINQFKNQNQLNCQGLSFALLWCAQPLEGENVNFDLHSSFRN